MRYAFTYTEADHATTYDCTITANFAEEAIDLWLEDNSNAELVEIGEDDTWFITRENGELVHYEVEAQD